MIIYLPYIVIAAAVIAMLLINRSQTLSLKKFRDETDSFLASLGQRVSAIEEESRSAGERNVQVNDLKLTQLREDLQSALKNFTSSMEKRLAEHEAAQNNHLAQINGRLASISARDAAPSAAAKPSPKPVEPAPQVRETPIHEKAKRLARLIVADIALYNAAAVEEGVRNNTLAKLLSHEIREARALYSQRVPEEVRKDTTYLEEAFKELITKKKRELNL